MQIGYVGVGSMGGALARRLVHNHKIIVWDLNSAAAAAFEKLGASVAATASEVARRCDIVLLCLPRSSDVYKLIFGPSGLLEGLSPGKLIVDQTSGVPSETRAMAAELAERGIAMIDAPVSGGVVGADAGTIAIMASGPDHAYQRALPVLKAISPNVFLCGGRVGDGQAMKLVNNLLSAGCRLSTYEVVAMGRKMGLPLAAMTDVLDQGPGRNRTSKLTLQELADGKLNPSNFAMALMLKDMNQAIQLGRECGAPTILTNLVRGLLQIGVNTLGESAQLEDAIGLIGSMAGTRIFDPLEGASPAPPPAVIAPKPPSVGYVGLGTMGAALARRLMLSHTVRVYDARPEAVKALVAEGAIAASDLAALARDCDVIFTCLPTSATVRDVIFDKGGLVESLAPGKTIVDQTTGDPALTPGFATDLAKFGVRMVDAPVAGGARGAVAGTITIMAGGTAETVGAVRPLLESISPNVVYCGKNGNGHLAELIHSAVATCNVLLTYEAASLAVRYGLSLADVATVVNKSTGCSGASERILPTLSQGKSTADFELQLMVKDLKLAGRLAIDCGAPMMIANTVGNQVAAHDLGGEANIDSMARLYESMAGIHFEGA